MHNTALLVQERTAAEAAVVDTTGEVLSCKAAAATWVAAEGPAALAAAETPGAVAGPLAREAAAVAAAVAAAAMGQHQAAHDILTGTR